MSDDLWMRLALVVAAFFLGYIHGLARGMVRGFKTCRRYVLTYRSVPPDTPFISVPNWNARDE